MIVVCQKSTISFFRMLKMCGQLFHFALWQNMKHQKIQKLFLFNHISVAIYSILNCLIVLIAISVVRLEYMNLRWKKILCIILPLVLYHFAPCTGQNDTGDTHFEWFVSSTNVTLCLYFFLRSCSQYLTVYYTSKSNKIYPVIKAGKIF